MSIKSLTEKFNKAREIFIVEVTKEFLEELKPIFEKYPKLESFSWSQGTPSWNDGDPCYFGVNAYSDNIYINEEHYEDWDESEDCKWKEKCSEEISKLVESIPEEVLEDTYGEGRVTINKDGTSDTEYEEC